LVDLKFKLIDSINAIDPEAFSCIINTDNPFSQFEFFQTLEDSSAIGGASGWITQHLTVFQHGKLIAFVPLFIKTNSYGEYVFDFEWANAYQSYGLSYYPKLVSAIPFTPTSGKRIFIAPEHSLKELLPTILSAIKSAAEHNQFSSWHLLFLNLPEHQELQNHKMLSRLGVQFHWHNKSYINFEDFLKQLTRKRRKDINRERKKVISQGISFSIFEGKNITSSMWAEFYVFYQLTYAKKSRQKGYLTEEFFILIGQRMPENIVMVIAEENHNTVAAALYFKDKNTLYGRYWGCHQEFDFLHFEACYYQGIEYCITHKLKKFDAGAQGEHKIQRGFEPELTYSNHWIENEAFSEAIKDYLKQERLYIQNYFQAASEKSPFKHPA